MMTFVTTKMLGKMFQITNSSLGVTAVRPESFIAELIFLLDISFCSHTWRLQIGFRETGQMWTDKESNLD